MADGGLTLTLTLDETTGSLLRAAADAAGLDVSAYAREQLERTVDDRWAEARRRLAEYDRTGEAIELDDFLRDFDAELEAALAKKRS